MPFIDFTDCLVDSEENSNDATSEQVADPILDAILAQEDSVDGIDLNTALSKDELSSISCSFAHQIPQYSSNPLCRLGPPSNFPHQELL